ncbi:MAG: flagellar basal body rod protein FlgC [Bdellovibrionales bacterium]|nr:flagellar basal body rod protein FlgC [Bdellovibrionales bacterium]
MSGMNDAVDILSRGLSAARLRVNVLASNIANAETTRSEDGGPYKKRMVVQVAKPFTDILDNVMLAKPEVKAVITDPKPPKQVYKPGHPDADENGYIQLPNINVVQEMTEMMSASRAYQATTTALETAKKMAADGERIAGRF